jgi:ribosomal protein S18 acetylase RimI-like enzyme
VEFVVRLCGSGDEEALSLVGQGTILETYAGITEGADLYEYVANKLSVESFRKTLAGDSARAWLVETEVGRCAVGYALVLPCDDAATFEKMELERLYVFYRFHGLGLGKRVMDEVLAFARTRATKVVSLRVNAQNTQSIAFYERYGFKTVSEEPFRAGDREYRVLVMELSP